MTRQFAGNISEEIGGAVDPEAATVEDVTVNLRGRDLLVPEKLLNRANVVPPLQQIRRKRVPQAVRRRGLADPTPADRSFESPLDGRFMKVMPALDSTLRLAITTCRRKNPLPSPRTPSPRHPTLSTTTLLPGPRHRGVARPSCPSDDFVIAGKRLKPSLLAGTEMFGMYTSHHFV